MALVQNVSFSFREWETMPKWVTFLTHYLEIYHKHNFFFGLKNSILLLLTTSGFCLIWKQSCLFSKLAQQWMCLLSLNFFWLFYHINLSSWEPVGVVINCLFSMTKPMMYGRRNIPNERCQLSGKIELIPTIFTSFGPTFVSQAFRFNLSSSGV
jgi:hypothetical protein